MRRREFLGMTAGAVALWPLAAGAQPPLGIPTSAF
jgi:hypothetical protein